MANVQRFNQISNWVASEIVQCPSLKERVALLEFFIRVADESFSMQNFCTALQVYRFGLLLPLLLHLLFYHHHRLCASSVSLPSAHVLPPPCLFWRVSSPSSNELPLRIPLLGYHRAAADPHMEAEGYVAAGEQELEEGNVASSASACLTLSLFCVCFPTLFRNGLPSFLLLSSCFLSSTLVPLMLARPSMSVRRL